MLRWSMAVVCLALATSPVLADPLRPSDLPASMKTCFHLDLDLVYQFDWLREMQQYLLTESELARHLETLPPELQFVTQMQVHDITGFTLSEDEDDFVLRVRAEADVSKLERLLTGEPDHVAISYEGHTVHHINVDAANWAERVKFIAASEDGPQTSYVATPEPGVFLFSSSLRSLTDTLDVNANRASCLAPETFEALSAKCPENVLFRYHCLPSETAPEQDGVSPPRVADVIGSVDKKLHLLVSADMGTKSFAQMMLQYAQPDKLRQFVSTTIMPPTKKAKPPQDAGTTAPTTDTAQTKDQDKGKGKKNALTVGLGFNGHGLQDIDEVVSCILRSLNIEREDRMVHFRWSSYADFRYGYRVDDGKHFHQFMFNASMEEPTLTADKPNAKSVR